MKIKLAPLKSSRKREAAACYLTGAHWQDDAEALDRTLRRKLIPEVKRQGFSGKAGEIAVFQTHGTGPADYVLLAGTAATGSTLVWQRVAHALANRCNELRTNALVLHLSDAAGEPEAIEQLAETLLMGSYRFDEWKSTKPRVHGLASVTLVAAAVTPERQAALRAATNTAEAVTFARDLINRPADTVTPTYLAQRAVEIGSERGLSVRTFGIGELRDLKMGGILGVAQGSEQPPAFIELIYRPKGKAKKVVAIAGKGITFDSGGLSLKTGSGMEAMKRDMAGGANVLAIMSALPHLGLPIEVRGYVAASENMPDGRAIKPGDVLRAYNGKTIEVLNTDAEGRLVLADALSFAVEQKPDVLIDIATLTGAVRMALGTRYAAVMGSNPALVRQLLDAGTETGDYLWELPLVAEYRSDIDSQVADIKNMGEGSAGTIVAGIFLKEFTGNVPWAHIDFSNTVMSAKPLPGIPRGATGFGVRLLLRYLRSVAME